MTNLLVEYLKKKVGRVIVEKLSEGLNSFCNLAVVVWMVRTDLLKETIKLFPAAAMMMNALETGMLNGIHTIVVCSSGNFAWAIACIARDFGKFNIIAIVPKSITAFKKQRLKDAGVEVIESDDPIARADELAKKKGVLHLDQYRDPANSKGVELYLFDQILRSIIPNVIIAMLGTGGTAVGLGQAAENQGIKLAMVGVRLKKGHKISGMRDEDRLRETEQPYLDNIDYLVDVEGETSRQQSCRMNDGGLPVGTSTGAGWKGFECWMQEQKDHLKLFRGSDGIINVVIPCADAYSAAI